MGLVTPGKVIARARALVGVPFLHQGRTALGLDCVGLIEATLAPLGALPPGYTAPRNYGPRPGAVLREHLERWCMQAPALGPAVLLEIRWPRASESSHVALLTDRGTVIHALSHRRSGGPGVVEQAYRGALTRLVVEGWRLPGVGYE